ncbi:hypothetical protein MesoLjLc_58970 [Mesorhizobium sp. L-8-10]|uniref:hypothetical protein n=1 Tax=Mesorhizobium sp. L-8-10 TaxID=2744523 RepID=UPI0019267288|nr:hypothetical protein [Mesorhizobium sp. L-8-10]BCH33967.1 hypothetical protein MesoLjLc_58970 [Mesorhizobium sp. L-8-10]
MRSLSQTKKLKRLVAYADDIDELQEELKDLMADIGQDDFIHAVAECLFEGEYD